MDLVTLRYLMSVIDAGSMSAAARRLGTTRSNVSRRIKALEVAVHAQVLRRSTRRVEPTEIGWALYQHARRILREMAALEATVNDLGSSLRGHVRLSVPTGLGQIVFGPLLLEFAERYPDITLRLTFSNYIFDLLSDEIDLAVRLAAEPPAGYRTIDLGPVDWVLCATPDYHERHAIHKPVDLARCPAVTPQLRENRLVLRLRGAGNAERVELRPRLQSADLILARTVVERGGGVGVLPRYAVAEALTRAELVELLPTYRVDVGREASRLYLVTVPSPSPPPPVCALLEFLGERLDHAFTGAPA